MSGWSLALPTVGAVGAGMAAASLQRRLRPATAALVLALLASSVAVGAAAVVLSVAGLYVAQLSAHSGPLQWCFGLDDGHVLPVWLGLGGVATALAMLVSAGSTLRRFGRHRSRESRSLVVLPSDDPTAFAVPGRPGHVVVSTGMLRQLDGSERRVLLAHERAHLRLHHHRYLLAAGLAAAVAPPLRPVLRWVRFATERWADEAAAGEVGDRELVAQTIARAALAQTAAPALALAGFGVRARVEALLDEPDRPLLVRLATLAVVTVTAAGIVSSVVQLHHVGALLQHICR